MEDVLQVYTRRYKAGEVLVCMDEATKQQIMEVRRPVPPAPGREYRYDAEYQRNGVSNLFMFFAPLANWRHVQVTDRRTARDWAGVVRQLVDGHFPQAEKIILVMDNLNTHSPASLYEAFSPAEARRILDKLEFITPRNMGVG
jgi:hypothetical protein